jgi:protein-L-isoaspartate(D-aspartate) O-methyltransferase
VTRQPTPERLLATIRAAGVRDRALLAAIGRVPRAEFVPPQRRADAYWDEPLPIPHAQVTTQPSLVARMVAALRLRGGERVLEVGTGYGWQTALLAELAAEVWSVERFDDVAEAARANLARHGAANAHVVVGDGSAGLPERSPYEAIVVSAAHPEVPEPLEQQLAPGGRLVIPLGPGGDEDVVAFERTAGGLERRASVSRAHFVRLVGAHAFED